jgi:hypothetical protein
VTEASKDRRGIHAKIYLVMSLRKMKLRRSPEFPFLLLTVILCPYFQSLSIIFHDLVRSCCSIWCVYSSLPFL